MTFYYRTPFEYCVACVRCWIWNRKERRRAMEEWRKKFVNTFSVTAKRKTTFVVNTDISEKSKDVSVVPTNIYNWRKTKYVKSIPEVYF